MTYPEQLKQMTNEELLEAHRINAQKGNKKDIDFANAIIMMRDCEAELLSRMEQPSQEHLKKALEEIQEKSQTACFQSNPHSYIKPMGEILKIATKALKQK